MRTKCIVTVAILLWLGGSSAMAGNSKYLQLDTGWEVSCRGSFQCRHDMRDLLVIYHPFTGSTTGDFGMAQHRAVIPASWQPPYTLSFYCTDDYTSDEQKPPTNDYIGHDIYPHHRFKQVLIDGRVVWERDVADPENYGNRDLIRVDITPYVKPGKPFELAIRVFDKVGTDTPLDSDFYWESGYTGGPGRRDVKYPFKFRTCAYWGDICLADKTGVADISGPRPRPSTVKLQQVHKRRWPLPPYGEKLPPQARLALESLAPIPASGFPATCGVPLPAGRVKDPQAITLRDGTGKIVPVQTSVLNRWKDGSIRWLLLTFEATRAPRRNAKWTLQLTAPPSQPQPATPVVVRKLDDGVIRISTGAIVVRLGRDRNALIDEVRLAGRNKPVARGIRAHMAAAAEGEPRQITATVRDITVTERGPLRVTVEERGVLAGEGLTVGRFVFRIHAYAGKPYLRTFFRIFNDSGGDLRIPAFGLVVPADVGQKRQVAWGAGVAERCKLQGGEVVLRQASRDAYEVSVPGRNKVTGTHAAGWMAVTGERAGALVAVRDFWQLFPKALRCSQDGLQVDLTTPTTDLPFYIPHDGEAKRHELMLGFFPRLRPSEADALGQAFQSPPRLMDKQWFCNSGGFGYAYWHDDKAFPRLTEFMRKTYGEVKPENTGHSGYGLRNFGDGPYHSGGQWRNNYYDCQQGLLAEYIMTGDRRWFDRFAESCRHYQDIDICHHSAAHPDWVGLVHTIGQDHSIWGGPWAAFERGIGLCMHWRLTGDPDSRDAFLKLAEAIVRTGQGAGIQYSRNWAGPMTTLVQAYDETWDPKWAEVCRQRVETLYKQIIDPRRGVYMDQHGHYSYRGMVPWMDAQVSRPLYMYYRLTGDLQAADAVVAIAEALIEEAMTLDAEHKMWGYSTNPHFSPTEGYNVLIAPAILYAYELTGEPAFLAVGRLLYERTIEGNSVNHVLNCYWNTPTLLYYLHKWRNVSARLPWD